MNTSAPFAPGDPQLPDPVPPGDARTQLLEHRRQVRALFATLRAIIRRTAETGRPVDEFVALLEGRLGALSRVQDMLMRMGESRAELTEVVSAEFLAQGVDEERIGVHGPYAELSSRVAGSLALAIHELTSNAIQFGALSTAAGQIHVSWSVIGPEGELRLTWRESGASVLSDAPRRRGFGFELLEQTLPYELGARTRLELAPGGLSCVIEFAPRGRGRT